MKCLIHQCSSSIVFLLDGVISIHDPGVNRPLAIISFTNVMRNGYLIIVI